MFLLSATDTIHAYTRIAAANAASRRPGFARA